MGDPDAQTVLMRLKSDLMVACNAAIEKNLNHLKFEWNEQPAMSVVLAAEEYPKESKKSAPIIGMPNDLPDNVKIFHANTSFDNGQLITNGARVLCITALGENMQQARSNVYKIASLIYWPDVQYRNDIGYRAITTK
jgi:phosphoribosylamine---glycine ligase